MRDWLHPDRYDGDPEQTLSRCAAAKGATTVSVVIPALNEEGTVGAVVSGVLELVARGFVDELVVIDGGSDDGTVAAVQAAGGQVVALADLMPVEPHPGKGGALWGSLRVTSGELVLFLDADVAPFDWGWVPSLLEPLLVDPRVHLVKGCYHRPVGRPGEPAPGRGGRVTELVARPLLALLWPELSRLRQPLAGETAARRTLLEALPFATGYGVEIGLLLDTYQRTGLPGLAQVDLGTRWHAPQDDEALARMAAVVLHAALRRAPADRRLPGSVLWQFPAFGDHVGDGVAYEIPRDDLPTQGAG